MFVSYMKKIYTAPQMAITKVEMTSVLATSEIVKDSTEGNQLGNGEILVKKTEQNYNVWDDDWSK